MSTDPSPSPCCTRSDNPNITSTSSDSFGRDYEGIEKVVLDCELVQRRYFRIERSFDLTDSAFSAPFSSLDDLLHYFQTNLSSPGYVIKHIKEDHRFACPFPKYHFRSFVDESLVLVQTSPSPTAPSNQCLPFLIFEKKCNASKTNKNFATGRSQVAKQLINLLYSYHIIFGMDYKVPLIGICGDNNSFFFVKFDLDTQLVQFSDYFNVSNCPIEIFRMYFAYLQNLVNTIIALDYSPGAVTLGSVRNANEFSPLVVDLFSRVPDELNDSILRLALFYRLVLSWHSLNNLRCIPLEFRGSFIGLGDKLLESPHAGEHVDLVKHDSQQSHCFIAVTIAALKEIQRVHLSGIIHRDCRFPNLVFTLTDDSGWSCKLIDFEFAKNIEQDPSDSHGVEINSLPENFDVPPSLRSHTRVVYVRLNYFDDYWFFISSLFRKIRDFYKVSITSVEVDAKYGGMKQLFEKLITEKAVCPVVKTVLSELIAPYNDVETLSAFSWHPIVSSLESITDDSQLTWKLSPAIPSVKRDVLFSTRSQ
ncbi:hypothetical protein GEMRC1_000863 [Eukaryota sp. GEM-RC1]